jgi:hypothetical protein
MWSYSSIVKSWHSRIIQRYMPPSSIVESAYSLGDSLDNWRIALRISMDRSQRGMGRRGARAEDTILTRAYNSKHM